MGLSANIAQNVTGVVASGTKSAAGMALARQQGDDKSSVFDVYTHTIDGLSDRMVDAVNDPASALLGDPAQQARVIAAMAPGQWESSSVDQWIDSAIIQQDALKSQWDAIGDAKGVMPTIGATFALLTGVEQMLSTMLSIIPFPAFPAVRITDMAVGYPHAHPHPPNLIPPNPVPIPLPSTGPLIPIPLLSGASKTLINGMPAARCGDMGLGVWCGGYVPMYEIFLGSSNVWIEGSRAARVAVDITKHCIFADPPIGPPFGMTVSSSPNVLIGGVPMPSLLGFAMGGAIKGLFKGLGLVAKKVSKLTGFSRKAKPPALSVPTAAASPNLSGKTSGHFMPTHTDRVDEILANLKPGERMDIPDGITASELGALTRATDREFGVVINNGRLQLIHGTDELVPIAAGDHAIVHTHPDNYKSYKTPVSDGDVGNAAHNAQHKKWDHPQAVIDRDGNVHHFDQNGVVDKPTVSPIQQDGNIDGVHSSPTGAPLHAVPPGLLG